MLENLAACVILGVSIVALMSLWTFALNNYLRTGEVQEAAQLARAELERCKAFGVQNLPLGTVSGTTATYTGSFDTSTNSWASGTTQYYNYAGQRVSGVNADGVRFALSDTFTDSSIATTSGSYGFTIKSRRAVVVTVTILPSRGVVKMGTNIVTGGL